MTHKLLSTATHGRRAAAYYLCVAADGWAVVRPVLEVIAGLLLGVALIPLFLIGLSARGVVWAVTRTPEWLFNLFLAVLAWHAHVVLTDDMTDEISELANGRQTALSDFK